MDYITRQFIHLATKLRDDVRRQFRYLRSDLSGITGNLRWRYVKSAFEVAGIVAVIVYTFLTYKNWQEQIDATNFAGKQAEKARQSLNETIKNFRIDERAWVSLVFPVRLADAKKIVAGTPFKFKISFKNTGKTPALGISYDPILLTVPITSNYPDYDAVKGPRSFMEQVGIKESALLAPGEETFITYPGQPINGPKVVFDKSRMVAIDKLQVALCIVGMVSYHDVFPHTPERHTKFCLVYSPRSGEVGACPVGRTMD